jgi:Na+/H+ antiporter NhaC
MAMKPPPSSSTRTLWFLVLGLIGLASLAFLPIDQSYLRRHEEGQAFASSMLQWKKQLPAHSISFPWHVASLWDSDVTNTPQWSHMVTWNRLLAAGHIALTCEPAPCSKTLLWKWKQQKWLPPIGASSLQARLIFHQKPRRHAFFFKSHITHLQATLTANTAGTSLPPLKASSQQKGYHWTAIIPPLLAIILALLTRRVLLSLFCSLLLGAIMYHDSVWMGLFHGGKTYLWDEAIYKEFSFNIIFFTLSLIGLINVCTRNGGIRGLIDKLVHYAATPRSSRLMTAILGLLIFFDDYANTIMVGNTMRPLTDKYRVSREKLAYLIDSTAAPIAAVALLSTWIGYEVGLLTDIASQIGIKSSGYQLFLESLSYRFYCLMTLIFVFIGILLHRDFGPMYEAEKRAWFEGKLLRDGAQPMIDIDMEQLHPPDSISPHWFNAVLPISIVFVSGFVGLLWVGGFFQGQSAYEALKAASFNSSRIFLLSALLGSLVAIGLSVSQRLLTIWEATRAWIAGARAMVFAVGILILAWAMSALTKDLGTAYILISVLKGHLRPEWLPLLVFFLAASVSFSTGTSWGAMGILLPTVAPLAYSMGDLTILYMTIGAVLDGSIFGDHCSPLSDTTLFSSAAAACDHVDHVRTQAPYAISVMLVAAVAGYLLVAFGGSIWISFGLAIISFSFIFRIFGKSITFPETTPTSAN